MKSIITTYLKKNTEAAPLAVFRIFFGAIMLFSILRFQYNGWIEKLYIEPSFFFSYYGFEWVKPLGNYTYWLFAICGIAAFLVMIGWQYRMAILTFFLSFSYLELMDKTNYLNHYYFVSCLSFLMTFLPANALYSVDAWKKGSRFEIPKWSLDAVKLFLSIVWFYAGLAKLNSDWLLDAQPLKIWLTAKYDIPILGDLLQKEAFHYLFSWSGGLYDLCIPFLLWNHTTRNWAFLAVVVFHLLTWILFPIGVFPWVMIGSATIFLDAKWHDKIGKFGTSAHRLRGLAKAILERRAMLKHRSSLQNRPCFRHKAAETKMCAKPSYLFLNQGLTVKILSLFILFQIIFPFRHLMYDGELFWTEEGFRFSWRVMLMEKAGYANFKIKDPKTGRQFYVQNGNFLNPQQEKQMATQPDFILEYAHFLKRHYQKEGIANPAVYVESFVALNGRSSRPFIDPNVDLTKYHDSWKAKTFILPFNDVIYGF